MSLPQSACPSAKPSSSRNYTMIYPRPALYQFRRISALALLSMGVSAASAADITWTGTNDSQWGNSANWSPTAPAQGDVILINSGMINFTTDPGVSYSALRMRGGELNITGGALKANSSSRADTTIAGNVNQTGGLADINELEIGAASGTTGSYNLTDGEFIVGRQINGFALYLGSNHDANAAGDGTMTISGGSVRTRAGVKLGDSSRAGTGHFAVLGSNTTSIGIGSSNSGFDAKWEQNAGSTLQVGIDTGGVTTIFLDDNNDTTPEGASAVLKTVQFLMLAISESVRAVAPGR